MKCVKLEQDVEHLRLANVGLERASEANQELANVNTKLSVANEEMIMHLREKGELAQEILRLNRALNDAQEKFVKEETKAQQYKAENEQLNQKVEKCEIEINELVHINETLRGEFLAVNVQYDQLKSKYTEFDSNYLELRRQLDEEKRLNKFREDELIECKRVQLEMLNAEVERYAKQAEKRKDSQASLQIDPSILVAPLSEPPSSQGSPPGDRRNPNFAPAAAIFSGIKRIFVPAISNPVNMKLNQKLTFCTSASVPKREIFRWNCTELEVYAMQFQPGGSLLATGSSDKYIHLWEVAANGHAYPHGSLQGSHGAINTLDFDTEGARLIAGCSGDKAFLWSYGDNRTLKDTCTGHTGLINVCRFHTATKLVTGSADRLIKTWDLHRRECVRTIFAGSKCHDLVVTDPVGTIVSAHFDKTIRFWDTLSDRQHRELNFTAAVTSLSFNAGKQQLLACLKDDNIQLIDLRQNRTLCTLKHDKFQVNTDTHKAVLSPDAQYVCTGSQDGSLIVWNTSTSFCENVLERKHKTMVTSVVWHPEGKYVASCEKHREVILWSD